MDEELIQRSVQFPKSLFDELSKIAKAKGISYAAVVREACIDYLNSSTPGLCKSCFFLNQPDVKFCSNCGIPLIEEQKIPNNKDTEIQKIREELNDVKKTLSKCVNLIKTLQEKLSENK